MQRYLFESGPEGATLNTTNSGATTVVAPGGTLTFAAAMAQSGSFGAQSVANNAQSLARFRPDAVSASQRVSVVLTIPDVIPAADLTLFSAQDASSGVCFRLLFRTTGSVAFADKNGNQAFAAAGVLTRGAKYRFEFVINGGSTTASSVVGHVYTPTGTSALATINSSTLNLSANPIDHYDFGNHGGVATLVTFGFDNIQLDSNPSTSAEIGPYVPGANTPPTVNAGPNQTVAAGAVVNLTGTASDSDGAIASTQWTALSYPGTTAPTITNPTALAASFTATTAGKAPYVFQLAATDNGGATSTSTVTIYVPDTTVSVIGVTDNSGVYTANPSSSTIASILSDGLDATYIESPASPATAATIKLRLGALKAVSPMTIALTGALIAGAGNLTVQAQLLEGSTVRKTWSITPTTSAAEIDLVVDATAAASIGSFNALDLALSTTGA